MEEIWKDIPHYEGRYQVSNMGRVRSIGYSYNCGHRYEQQNRTEAKILSLNHNHKGYATIRLSDGKVRKGWLVHILVWITFNGPIPKGLQVNHINEIKDDNHLTNLNLMTQSENMRWGTGIQRRKKKMQKRVLQSTLDGKPFFCYFSAHDAEIDMNGKYSGTISRICNGVRGSTCKGYKWSYITEK